jgi:hypothetical protein
MKSLEINTKGFCGQKATPGVINPCFQSVVEDQASYYHLQRDFNFSLFLDLPL